MTYFPPVAVHSHSGLFIGQGFLSPHNEGHFVGGSASLHFAFTDLPALLRGNSGESKRSSITLSKIFKELSAFSLVKGASKPNNYF